MEVIYYLNNYLKCIKHSQLVDCLEMASMTDLSTPGLKYCFDAQLLCDVRFYEPKTLAESLLPRL